MLPLAFVRGLCFHGVFGLFEAIGGSTLPASWRKALCYKVVELVARLDGVPRVADTASAAHMSFENIFAAGRDAGAAWRHYLRVAPRGV